MNTALWIGKAKERIKSMDDGTVFVLKDLFDGVEWTGLTVGERRTFGRTFKNEVKERSIPDVCFIGTAQNNSSRYMVRKMEA